MNIRSLVVAGMLALSSLVTFSGTAAAQSATAVPPAKEQAIRKLLQLTKAGEMGMQMMDQMAGQLKPMFPKVPDQFWSDFFKEIKISELVDKIVPIYAKHLTDSDIAELIKFYQSPAGQKLISVQPMIVQESSVVGQAWGREIGERVVKRLQEKGLLDNGGPPKKK